MKQFSRRTVLRTIAGTTGIGTAGCLSPFGDENDQLIQLGGGQVFNAHQEPHDVFVELRRAGTVVLENTYRLTPAGTTGFASQIARTWPKPATEFSVRVRRDDGTTRRISLARNPDEPICNELYVFVDSTERLVAFSKPATESDAYYCTSEK